MNQPKKTLLGKMREHGKTILRGLEEPSGERLRRTYKGLRRQLGEADTPQKQLKFVKTEIRLRARIALNRMGIIDTKKREEVMRLLTEKAFRVRTTHFNGIVKSEDAEVNRLNEKIRKTLGGRLAERIFYRTFNKVDREVENKSRGSQLDIQK